MNTMDAVEHMRPIWDADGNGIGMVYRRDESGWIPMTAQWAGNSRCNRFLAEEDVHAARSILVDGKPVARITLTDDIRDSCDMRDSGRPNEHGVIVHYFSESRAPRLVYSHSPRPETSSIQYRDDTLVPFYAYYSSVEAIDIF